MIRVVDLFCGIGGFSEGVRQAGGEVVLAIDSDPLALDTHRRNHPRCRHMQLELPQADLPLPTGEWHLHTSPPCQKVSQANRQVSSEQRERAIELLEWCFDVVESSMPTTWSFEQVVTPLTIELLGRRRKRKPSLYAYLVVNFADYGVPQDRRRLVAGSPALIRRFLEQKSQPPRVIKDVITPTPSQWVMNHTTNTPDRRGGHRPLRPEEHMRPVTRPAYTVMASASMRWVEPNGDLIRALTPREAATLQTFPKDYFIGDGSLASQRRGVGNAVSVEAARRWMSRE